MNEKEQVWYGGDYNPDQWPDDIIDVDFELFEKAHINILTLPVFSWSRIQKNEDSFDFDWLITILNKAKDRDIAVCFATSTAVQPAWLSKKYPDMLPVDSEGKQRRFGGRVNFCPNSQEYKIAAARLVEKLANIAKGYENIIMWHIGNEYDNYCYCDQCKKTFQQWVKKRYVTIETVNKKWYLNFWGHQIYDFDEIELPDLRSENWEMNGLLRTNFQSILLDYHRFMNESILSCYLNELDIVKRETPDIPVTTNFMGTYKPLDYFRWAKYLDVISWDHYPALNDPPFKSAMRHDLMRSLKKDKPFWLMEQSPSQQNWSPYNTLKRPGELRLQSYQTLARGADAIMFFQMRRSIANCEKFHGALIDHVGHDKTRVFKECSVIGNELKHLKEIIGSRVKARIGIVFDWENWWAVEMSSGPSIDLQYINVIESYYQSIHKQNHMVDFLWEEDDFSNYDCVYAPMLYLVTDRMKDKLEKYVASGGNLVLTTFSGLVDENDHVTTLGYPGEFREMAGLWVEEIDGLLPDMNNTIKGFSNKNYTCHLLCDVIHLEGAKALATFDKDFYKGYPAVTQNKYKNGQVYYIGTIAEDEFLNSFYDYLNLEITKTESKRNSKLRCIEEFIHVESDKVEVSIRYDEDDEAIFFILNHGVNKTSIGFDSRVKSLITGKEFIDCLELEPKDAIVIKKVYN